MLSINSISLNWGMLPLYQCWCTNTNQYPIWLNQLEVNPHNTHAIYFNIWVHMVNVNRFGHAEWHFQTTSCKVCFLYINVRTLTLIGTQHDNTWQKTHFTWHIKVRVNIPGWGTSILLDTQHSDIFRIAAVICVYWKPWCIQTYPFSPPCTGRSHMHGDSRMGIINSRSLVYTKFHPPAPSDQYRITTGTSTAYKTPLHSACMCQKPLGKDTNHQEKIPNIKLNFS